MVSISETRAATLEEGPGVAEVAVFLLAIFPIPSFRENGASATGEASPLENSLE